MPGFFTAVGTVVPLDQLQPVYPQFRKYLISLPVSAALDPISTVNRGRIHNILWRTMAGLLPPIFKYFHAGRPPSCDLRHLSRRPQSLGQQTQYESVIFVLFATAEGFATCAKRCQHSAPGDHLGFALFARIGLIAVFWLVIAMRSGRGEIRNPCRPFGRQLSSSARSAC